MFIGVCRLKFQNVCGIFWGVGHPSSDLTIAKSWAVRGRGRGRGQEGVRGRGRGLWSVVVVVDTRQISSNTRITMRLRRVSC